MRLQLSRYFVFLLLQTIVGAYACQDEADQTTELLDTDYQDIPSKPDAKDESVEQVAQLVIMPRAIALALGGELVANVAAYNASGVRMNGVQVTWQTDDPQVATVDPEGLVTGVQVGVTQLNVRFQDVVDSVEIHVKAVNRLEIVPNGGEIGLGEPVQLELRAYAENHEQLSVGAGVRWESTPNEIAEVGSNGIVNSYNPGIVQVLASIGDRQAMAEFHVEVKFDSMRCRANFCCMRSTQSEMYCWGSMDNGDTGNFTGLFDMREKPTRIETDLDFVSYDWRNGTICGLMESGEVYCWGMNYWKTVGKEDIYTVYIEPQRLETDLRFQEIGMTFGTACGLAVDGDLYCWGAKPFYFLGIGDSIPITLHARPYLLAEGPFTKLRTSDSVICLQGQDTHWSCIGHVFDGILGDDGSSESHLTPIDTSIAFLDLWPPNSFEGAFCGLSFKNEVYCWSDHYIPALGRSRTTFESQEDRHLPKATDWEFEFSSLRGNYNVSNRFCGRNMEETGILCWGSNQVRLRHGCGLGPRVHPSLQGSYRLQFIDGMPEDLVDYGVTRNGGCGLTEGGDIWCWGLFNGSLIRDDQFVECEQWPERVSTF